MDGGGRGLHFAARIPFRNELHRLPDVRRIVPRILALRPLAPPARLAPSENWPLPPPVTPHPLPPRLPPPLSIATPSYASAPSPHPPPPPPPPEKSPTPKWRRKTPATRFNASIDDCSLSPRNCNSSPQPKNDERLAGQ